MQIGKFFCIGLLDFGKIVCDEIKIIRRNEFGKNLTTKNTRKRNATNLTFVFEVYLINKNKVFDLDLCVETLYIVIVHDRCANV